MTQEINLYQVEEEQEEVLLSFRQIMKAAGGFGCILLFISAFMTYAALNQDSEISSLKSQERALKKGIAKVKQATPKDETREKLKEEIAKLEKIKLIKQEMLNTLSRLQNSESYGYSRFMDALYRYTVTGIWFTNINVYGDGVRVALQGQTKNTDLIPILLKRLSYDDAFKGKTFEDFKVELEKDTRTKEQKQLDKERGVDNSPKILNFTIGSD